MSDRVLCSAVKKDNDAHTKHQQDGLLLFAQSLSSNHTVITASTNSSSTSVAQSSVSSKASTTMAKKGNHSHSNKKTQSNKKNPTSTTTVSAAATPLSAKQPACHSTSSNIPKTSKGPGKSKADNCKTMIEVIDLVMPPQVDCRGCSLVSTMKPQALDLDKITVNADNDTQATKRMTRDAHAIIKTTDKKKEVLGNASSDDSNGTENYTFDHEDQWNDFDQMVKIFEGAKDPSKYHSSIESNLSEDFANTQAN